MKKRINDKKKRSYDDERKKKRLYKKTRNYKNGIGPSVKDE